MRTLKIVLGVAFGVLVFLMLDYVLPSKNTVRVTNVYNQLTDPGAASIFYASPDSGTIKTATGARDIRFIATVKPNGKPFVYRNEDTGWVWPPYFKYDSSNLHAVASDQVSTAETAKWVSVTGYGWRIPMFSIYPNAISIRPVAGPDDRPVNWPALVICALLLAFLFMIWRMWNQFQERTIDPAVERVDQAWDQLDNRVDAARDRVAADTRSVGNRIRNWWGGLRK